MAICIMQAKLTAVEGMDVGSKSTYTVRGASRVGYYTWMSVWTGSYRYGVGPMNVGIEVVPARQTDGRTDGQTDAGC